MSLKNEKIFGLNVPRYLADIQDKNKALANLGINHLDLSVIYGSNEAGVDADDWRSFSGLNVPIFKTLDRYAGDVSIQNNVLLTKAGIDQNLFGNLDINGVLSGNAIRYKYIKGTGTSAFLKNADISTSRVSAWSSSDSRATSQDLDEQKLAKISYGSRIAIRPNASGFSKLNFGTQGQSGSPSYGSQATNGNPKRLQTTLRPTKVEFASEIPTSTIKIRLDGTDYKLYAMKGIPVAFRGFFRRLDNIECDYIQIGDKVPNWKVVRVEDRDQYSNYTNTSRISSYRSSRSYERFIELYYPSDAIQSLKVSNANIVEVPVAKFSNLTTYVLQGNQIKNFPDFTNITYNATASNNSKLAYFNISNNPLYLSDTRLERNFTSLIVDKIPKSITTLVMGRTYYGSMERNTIADRFPNLISLNLDRSGGPYFHPDSYDKNVNNNNTCTLPNVSDTVISYNCNRNDFRSIDEVSKSSSGNDSYSRSFTGDIEAGSNLIFNATNIHQLAPHRDGDTLGITDGSGTLSNASGAKIVKIKGRTITLDNTFSGTATGVNFSTTVTHTGRYNIKDLPNLESLSFYSNYYLYDSSFYLASDKLRYLQMGHTAMACPNLQNQSNLEEFHAQWTRNFGSTAIPNTTGSHNSFFMNYDSGTGKYSSYRLSGCVNLKLIRMYSARFRGPFPEFNHAKATSMDLRYCHNDGGDPNVSGGGDYCITGKTFQNCFELSDLRIISVHLLKKPIHEDAFNDCSKLRTLQVYSYKRVTGNLPSFSSLGDLRYLYMSSNAFTGTIPLFSASSNIIHIYLHNNQLSGPIGSFNGLTSLNRLYLHGNRRGGSTGFTSLAKFEGLPNLDRFYCQVNSIEGKIPDFSSCPNIRYLGLYENKFTEYQSGSISSLTRLKTFDVSDNNLIASEINKIIDDCRTNYDTRGGGGGVTIDLRGNVSITCYEPGVSSGRRADCQKQHLLIGVDQIEKVLFLRSKGWNFPGLEDIQLPAPPEPPEEEGGE